MFFGACQGSLHCYHDAGSQLYIQCDCGKRPCILFYLLLRFYTTSSTILIRDSRSRSTQKVLGNMKFEKFRRLGDHGLRYAIEWRRRQRTLSYSALTCLTLYSLPWMCFGGDWMTYDLSSRSCARETVVPLQKGGYQESWYAVLSIPLCRCPIVGSRASTLSEWSSETSPSPSVVYALRYAQRARSIALSSALQVLSGVLPPHGLCRLVIPVLSSQREHFQVAVTYLHSRFPELDADHGLVHD
ncbi:hypothetical protein OBBRIDRAFT_156759 [Obba rivulosa]|uniref:Uncharacterized protein n=1 Tax=Obba rivulosa TaxID=1052685 RepID=A0A8E2AMW8_9APHY|nr:hypothetical protein OBBRIDRAFT_156759 [Obba rivulosa]